MTWFPTVGQRVDTSPNGWTAAGGPRPNPSPYLKRHGFTMEDWNFAGDTLPDPFQDGSGPHVVGYGQGAVTPTRLRKAARRTGDGPRFDVCFFTREGGRHLVHGVYLNARYLTDADNERLVKTKRWTKLRANRAGEVAAFYPEAVDKHVKRFLKDACLRWAVRADRVLVLPEPIAVKPPGRATRFSNALDWSARPWWSWLGMEGDPGSPDEVPPSWEGKVKVAKHKSRERDPRFIAAVKKKRLATQGHLACDCCGLDLPRLYGSEVVGLIEGHHTDPVGDAPPKGQAYTEGDIALLCPSCHRVAHRSARLDVASLKELLPAGWVFPHPAGPNP